MSKASPNHQPFYPPQPAIAGATSGESSAVSGGVAAPQEVRRSQVFFFGGGIVTWYKVGPRPRIHLQNGVIVFKVITYNL